MLMGMLRYLYLYSADIGQAYRRGLLRCSFYYTGHAKASKRGTSDSAKVPRFFCAYWECLKLTHMDFIEFIMKTIFEIVGWFLGLIVKLVVGLFSLIFKGIASLFNR